MNYGIGFGRSSAEYRGLPSIVADVLVARRMGQKTGSSLATGVSANAYLIGPHTDECVLPRNGVGCLPIPPSFLAITALAGWEDTSATLRAMVGPAAIWHLETATGTVGLQARADGASRLVWPIDLMLFVHGTVIPSLHGQAFGYVALGFGLRVR
jgi:hypothetical protein